MSALGRGRFSCCEPGAEGVLQRRVLEQVILVELRILRSRGAQRLAPLCGLLMVLSGDGSNAQGRENDHIPYCFDFIGDGFRFWAVQFLQGVIEVR